MSYRREVVLRLLGLLVVVLASVGLWGVEIKPQGVFIALQIGAAAWVISTVIGGE